MSAAILKMIERVQMAAYGGDINGWVCEKVFAERSGLDTKDKRFAFRKKHPNLVKVNDEGKYIYNLPGYFETFKSV